MYKRYIKANGHKVNYLECEVFYSLGGMNYFTHEIEKRGYYLRVCPVEKSGNMVGFMAFSGIKKLLVEVARKNKKAEEQAEALVKENLENLVNHVCAKNNIILEENV